MAFEGLSSRFQEITRKLRGKARITCLLYTSDAADE